MNPRSTNRLNFYDLSRFSTKLPARKKDEWNEKRTKKKQFLTTFSIKISFNKSSYDDVDVNRPTDNGQKFKYSMNSFNDWPNLWINFTTASSRADCLDRVSASRPCQCFNKSRIKKLSFNRKCENQKKSKDFTHQLRMVNFVYDSWTFVFRRRSTGRPIYPKDEFLSCTANKRRSL